jgi:hypothetical protein
MVGAGLHVCGHCGSDLVHPVEWEEESPGLWYLERRCPECECASSGIYPQALVDSFDEVLERGTDAIVRQLKELVVENRACGVDAALHARRSPRAG